MRGTDASLPENAAVGGVHGDHVLYALQVSEGQDPSACDGEAGEARAETLDGPRKIRAAGRPLLEQPLLPRDAVTPRPPPLRPILARGHTAPRQGCQADCGDPEPPHTTPHAALLLWSPKGNFSNRKFHVPSVSAALDS